VPSTSKDAGWLSATQLWLGIPHRSQFDGTTYAQTNCGPTSLGMVLNAFGLAGYPSDALRGEVNRIMGNDDPNEGTSLPALAVVARRAGLYPVDLYSKDNIYRRWTIDDVRAHLKAGQPIITLVRYGDLPGNGWYAGDTNHYIVLAGVAGDNIIYNDAAYPPGTGRALVMSPDVLQRAWNQSVIPGHALAFALNPGGDGLLNLPPQTAVDEEEGDLVDLDSPDVDAADLSEADDSLSLLDVASAVAFTRELPGSEVLAVLAIPTPTATSVPQGATLVASVVATRTEPHWTVYLVTMLSPLAVWTGSALAYRRRHAAGD
jgi:hypothetical protein